MADQMAVQKDHQYIDLYEKIPKAWQSCLSPLTSAQILPKLSDFLSAECTNQIIYPLINQWFNAFESLKPDQVKVVIIGQDPYHGAGQGNGLAFSVNEGVKIPPSLLNIYKELSADLGLPIAKTGNLQPWVEQGVLLLNTVLTVREAEPNSHKNKGWEAITEDIIGHLGALQQPLAFVLWGAHAQRFTRYIESQHLQISAAHPSPLSAYRGFFGSQPFSQINTWLVNNGKSPINWQLADFDTSLF